MTGDCPFVITVASEKGGVGKTTIATNLAVYLKALREDLPVTIASFDNHFSVDNMFAIGGHRGSSVAGLFAGSPAGRLACLGEYGVQFLASDRQLTPPDEDSGHLAAALARSDLPGVLILDTRPIIDYFTRNALAAADLVLVPVKDRASLVNAASLQQALLGLGRDPARLWLIPSLIDGRLKLREDLGMAEFLSFSATERGYQVLETCISKSPKVEGLATSFSSRIYPVLTHARSTQVHRQFRQLADFVLARFDAVDRPLARTCRGGGDDTSLPAGRLRRLVRECPVCGRPSGGQEGYFFQDLRSRRKGFFHRECLDDLLAETEAAPLLPERGMLVFATDEEGQDGTCIAFRLHLLDEAGEEIACELLRVRAEGDWARLWQGATGRLPEELYRDHLTLMVGESEPAGLLADPGFGRFAAARRQALRTVLGKGGER
ncbi:hypothetical protein DESUT3_15680 [Desulfuromonas versatilis]|uniref:CobQ/CobB/MinD/ParA nucleotide binding domain-containing protein n=1 Tax=Desulfuromonas versatilis TaxID=2802975 RepID=A0ABM8HUW3_9BACT|nr:ParA family protein [Desulfuromonas versatilis]BCR04499.1 hypothetical protein DESUT3_15680 [Desulfuromonas versatilis]